MQAGGLEEDKGTRYTYIVWMFWQAGLMQDTVNWVKKSRVRS
jgi:hypothetical protein